MILNNPSMLRWCASTPKFLMAVLVLYPLAVYCYMYMILNCQVSENEMVENP